jgi:hypothetical protein
MSLDIYEMDSSMSGKLIWPKFTREQNSRIYAKNKEIEHYDPEVHLLAQLLTSGTVKRVR